jgi:glycosyltransferase involved in cell wall biosynthesis
LIRAFEQSSELRAHRLVMVGDGPELPRLRAIVASARLESSVELTGALPFSRVLELMYEAQVFAFPSIREQGGGVLTLASMASTPSVVVNYGGPAHRVPDDCGVRVSIGNFGHLVSSFRRELESLIGDPERIEAMGRAAREHTARYYDWRRKAHKTVEVYEWVLGRRSDKPDFWS